MKTKRRTHIHVVLTPSLAERFERAKAAAERRAAASREGAEVTQSSIVRTALEMWIAAQGAT